MSKEKGFVLDRDEDFGVNHIDDYTILNVIFIGKENKYGIWWIIKIDETGNFPVCTHATKINNNDYATYDEAWNAKTDLKYMKYSEAF